MCRLMDIRYRPGDPAGELHTLESDHIQISGLVVSTLAREYSHWAALASLDSWLKQNGVPALCGVDTRALTKKLRIQGCMLGKLLCEEGDTHGMIQTGEIWWQRLAWATHDGTRREEERK